MRSTGIAALGLIIVLAFALRVPSVVQPLGIDQGLFASAARAIDRGQVLYRDVWDQKPPAIFLIYRAAFTIFGWKPAAIGWLDLLASATTAGLLFAIARRLAGRGHALLATSLYSALTLPSWMLRNGGFLERSVAETFIGVAIAGAALAAIAACWRQGATGLAAACAGLAAGAAIAFKPNAGLYVIALLLWAALYRARDAPMGRLVVVAMAAVGVCPAATLIWIWSTGALADARVALVDFNRFYVTQSLSGRNILWDFANAIGFRVKFDPLWGAGAVGALAAAWELVRHRRLDPLAGLAIVWGAAAALVILLNGAWLFNTYFLQALPPLALLAAWTLAGLGTRSIVRRIAAVAAVVVIAVPLVQKNYPRKVLEVAVADVQHWRGVGDRAAYWDRFGQYGSGRGFSARANEELAAFIRERTAVDDRIYQFGINSAGLYFAADRLPAQRFLRVNEFVPTTFPAPGFDLASVARELADRRPAYLIFETLHTGTPMATAVDRLPEAPDLRALLSAYVREAQVEDYSIYRLRTLK